MGSLWPGLPFILPQASTSARGVDDVFIVLTLLALFFSIGIFGVIAFFAVRYRRGNPVNRVLPEHEGIALELTWTIIPLIILVVMFVWSTSVYFAQARVPKGAMEVMVVGKQWMWKIQQPNGRWEMNELHVPAGKPVKLTMISEDVIHDFGVPAFRLKMDVVPGRYTQAWFQSDRPDRYRLFCSQYCGTKHSIMGGFITVMEPADYERWLATGNVATSSSAEGEALFRQLGCTGCHGDNANVRAPSLVGLWNQPRPVQVRQPDGTYVTQVIKADYRYIHDSIVLPEKEVAGGYKPIMPTYRGQISEEQIAQLTDYIRSLGTSNGTSNGAAKTYIPENANGLDAQAGVAAANANANMGRTPDRDRVFQYGNTGVRSSDQANSNMGRTPDRDRIFSANDGGRQLDTGLRSGYTDSRPDSVGAPRHVPPLDAPNVYAGTKENVAGRSNPQPQRGSSSTPELDRSTGGR